jgi:hypothetical protein
LRTTPSSYTVVLVVSAVAGDGTITTDGLVTALEYTGVVLVTVPLGY